MSNQMKWPWGVCRAWFVDPSPLPLQLVVRSSLGVSARHWLQRPPEDVEDHLREVDALAEAGAAWVVHDTHPWQLFAMKLHEMFLGVLRDRKGADDEAGSLFPTSHRKEPRNTYPWHLLCTPTLLGGIRVAHPNV